MWLTRKIKSLTPSPKRMITKKTNIKVVETKIIIQEVEIVHLTTKMEVQPMVTTLVETPKAITQQVDTIDKLITIITTNITTTMTNTMTITAEMNLVPEAMVEVTTTKVTIPTQDEVDLAAVALTKIKGTTTTITKITNKVTKTTTILAIVDSRIRRIKIIMIPEEKILKNNNNNTMMQVVTTPKMLL